MLSFYRLGLFLLLPAGPPAQAGPPLALLGLAPGIPRAALEERVARLGGRLACKTSGVDSRFAECTTVLPHAPDGRRWSLLASLVDGSAAILLLTAPFDAKELVSFREELTGTLGRPNLRQRADQESFEWIRAGKMMRLTSRRGDGRLKVSVSLLQGDLLDPLGKKDRQ